MTSPIIRRGAFQKHSATRGVKEPTLVRLQRITEQIQLEDQALIYAVKRIANQRGISLLTHLNVWELG
ncbi:MULTISPECIES: hypothetical protein [unclassified Prochlorococcus]|uniref:hypothetical protein n=1 Tax=unclassified Prochlorococcus TaxID=2627481 RepID=UPI00145FCF5B|nr:MULTISPECIES: hypothetical protein [unclassified Prochlorococcus]NMO84306.1 hypothetical protein [Prochlorococcus sp. P1344]NMP13020.1 hypothetical protein [Prochlorococcus sp.P1363]